MSGVRSPTDDMVRRRIGQYHTFAGVNPSALELEAEARRLAIKPGETNEAAVQRTYSYVQRFISEFPHSEEWKDAREAVLGLLSEVRKHQEGEL